MKIGEWTRNGAGRRRLEIECMWACFCNWFSWDGHTDGDQGCDNGVDQGAGWGVRVPGFWPTPYSATDSLSDLRRVKSLIWSQFSCIQKEMSDPASLVSGSCETQKITCSQNERGHYYYQKIWTRGVVLFFTVTSHHLGLDLKSNTRKNLIGSYAYFCVHRVCLLK